MKLCKKKLHQYEDHLKQCPECHKASMAEYRAKPEIKAKNKARSAEYYAKPENKEKINASNAEWRAKPESKEKNNARNAKWRAKPENKAKNNAYQKARKKSDSLYKSGCNLRTLIHLSFKNKGWKKSSKTSKILGCTFEEIENHLENSAIKNYGSFDLTISYETDHIIPVSLARNEEEMVKLNHYSNLQYLTKTDNLQKFNKIFDVNGIEFTDLDKKIEILEEYLNRMT